MRISFIAILTSLVVGCGGSSAPAETPEQPNAAPEAEASETPSEPAGEQEANAAEEPKAVELPTECADGSSEPCLMPRAFVKALCSEAYPELALYFFAKDSPWTRIYVSARQVEPFNGHGGPSSDKNLVFDEELLVLAERDPNLGGMSVSGVGKRAVR